MPAHAWEIARAEEEGVVIHNGWGPVEVIGEKTATGLRFQKCSSVLDKTGSFNPEFDAETTKKANASSVILAVGQTADLEYVAGQAGIEADKGRIAVSEAQATGDSTVFAGGDVVSGPDSIINAIMQGRKAAGAMDAYLGGDGDIDEILGNA